MGSVNVFSLVAGPENLVNPLPVPPLEEAMTPVMPSVIDASAFVTAMLVPAVSVAFFHSDVVASRIIKEPAAGVPVI